MISFAVQAKHYLSVVVTAGLIVCAPLCAQTITTVVGTGTNGFTADGSAPTSTQLSEPSSVAFDSNGNLYIADQGNFRIRKVTGTTVATYAGSGVAGNSGDGKAATAAKISGVGGISFDAAGNLYLADTANSTIRKVTSAGIISTVAGVGGSSGFSGDTGLATKADLSLPADVIVDAAGNLYIADGNTNRIRLVTASTGIITTFAGNGNAQLTGDGGSAVNAGLYSPRRLAFDAAGNLYIADADNNAVRLVTPTGEIITVANTSANAGFSGDGGPATQAELTVAAGVAVDVAGNVFIADDVNCRIRKVATNGMITTIAGNGSCTFAGDGGPAVNASLRFPTGITLDKSGNLYIADSGNGSIREVTNVGVTALTAIPVIGAGGIISSSGFGAATSIAPGSLIEIYGSNLAADTSLWSGANFINGFGPTSLGGSTVTVGGLPAYTVYVSPAQINAFVPFGVATGSQPVVVHNSGGTSVAANVNVNALQPGLLATSAFKIAGVQYAAAVLPDFATYLLPAGAIAGINSRPAKPGDTIVLFGTGFGPVSPSFASGQIVTASNSLVNPVVFSIAGIAAVTTYQGLAPDEAGIYQFDLVVPANVPAGNAALTFTQANGTGGTQTLSLAIQN